ncbi:hypothetical protein SeLEV6574_g00067 [Synchytrium endobioticum]|uniref:C3H1-type domain-containing protein n=1 Tax=Synchytrium endobioticum TaxID=286115 RepID=A0A507DK17_9FUNG|nr:hypothetical protein SeLEV6574_g00067 [Synchytrium endobioticum]
MMLRDEEYEDGEIIQDSNDAISPSSLRTTGAVADEADEPELELELDDSDNDHHGSPRAQQPSTSHHAGAGLAIGNPSSHPTSLPPYTPHDASNRKLKKKKKTARPSPYSHAPPQKSSINTAPPSSAIKTCYISLGNIMKGPHCKLQTPIPPNAIPNELALDTIPDILAINVVAEKCCAFVTFATHERATHWMLELPHRTSTNHNGAHVIVCQGFYCKVGWANFDPEWIVNGVAGTHKTCKRTTKKAKKPDATKKPDIVVNRNSSPGSTHTPSNDINLNGRDVIAPSNTTTTTALPPESMQIDQITFADINDLTSDLSKALLSANLSDLTDLILCLPPPIPYHNLPFSSSQPDANNPKRASQYQKREFEYRKWAATTPCEFYMKGRCSLGTNCSFSHDISPSLITSSHLRKEDTRSTTICTFMIRGMCRNAVTCPYAHEKKNVPCIYHHLFRKCIYTLGNGECDYSHESVSEERMVGLKREWEFLQHNRAASVPGRTQVVAQLV